MLLQLIDWHSQTLDCETFYANQPEQLAIFKACDLWLVNGHEVWHQIQIASHQPLKNVWVKLTANSKTASMSNTWSRPSLKALWHNISCVCYCFIHVRSWHVTCTLCLASATIKCPHMLTLCWGKADPLPGSIAKNIGLYHDTLPLTCSINQWVVEVGTRLKWLQ